MLPVINHKNLQLMRGHKGGISPNYLLIKKDRVRAKRENRAVIICNEQLQI